MHYMCGPTRGPLREISYIFDEDNAAVQELVYFDSIYVLLGPEGC